MNSVSRNSNSTEDSSARLASDRLEDSNPSPTIRGPNRNSGTDDPLGFQFRQLSLPRLLSGTSQMETLVNADSLNFRHISGEMSEVFVHRSCLKEDLINIFKSESSKGIASFKVINERGDVENGDGIGVTRDVITTFWHQFFTAASLGDKEKVPSIRHDYQKSEWEAIARILVYGFKEAHYFPVGLSSAFLASCLFGEESISNDFLLASFKWYITTDEREIFVRITTGDVNEDDDDVLELLGNYQTYSRYTRHNISKIVTELAHQEIIQRPRYIAECWAPIVAELKDHAHFRTPDAIVAFTAQKTPTTRKVIKAINCNPSNDAERQSFDFLKKFIRSLDASALGTFLKYITGNDTMPECVTVSFTSVDGLARRPIAHTCGQHLELPNTYHSFNELSEEFTSLLRDKGAWAFNIV